jgi:hypothetical protein
MLQRVPPHVILIYAFYWSGDMFAFSSKSKGLCINKE